jgi:hypothetical protein
MRTYFKFPFIGGILFTMLLGAQCSIAQTVAPSAPAGAPQSAARTPAPDGVPTLAKDIVIDQSTSVREERANAQAGPNSAPSEEKIENRLAVIRSGGYVVTDPNVGRYDRATSNGVKRVAPSMWELFRF